MCNLYTYKHSPEEMISQKRHFNLIGQQWSDVFEKRMAGTNDEALVYPRYLAPVVIVRPSTSSGQAGERELADLGWGMPAPVAPLTPGETPKRPRENLR
jgi:putative SOS response-associated peptidase YedK